MATVQPAYSFQVGRAEAAIWENSNGKGDVWFNVTLKRIYMDGDVRKSSDSFGRNDLPHASRALDIAFYWIWEQENASIPTKATD